MIIVGSTVRMNAMFSVFGHSCPINEDREMKQM